MQTPAVRAAFRRCRDIARREAKNFYYAFLVLPPAKRNAMCAMYAFMRRADDIADDESLPVEERRVLMTRWLAAFHADAAFDPQDAPVFLAVRETQRRFGIGGNLLDELVAGTSMDLAADLPTGVVRLQIGGRSFDAYTTVEALDRYCYLVASVVGLVTIRIFGFSDARANAYAIDLGKAFQYTNILRDVREDAERGRVYLPQHLLNTHGETVEGVVVDATARQVSPGVQAAMAALGTRAENFYGAGRLLVPLLDRDSRGAMQVLIGIYHALLLQTRTREYQVMGQRVRVSTSKKLALLAKGLVTGVVGRFA